MSIPELVRSFLAPPRLPELLVRQEAARHKMLLDRFFSAGIRPGEFCRKLGSEVCRGPLPIQIGGAAGLVSVAQVWDEGSERTLGELLRITRLSAEGASRIGASMLLQGRLERQSLMSLVEATVAAALLRGCTQAQLADALSIALSCPPRLHPAALDGGGRFHRVVIDAGRSAVADALDGRSGPGDLLGSSDGPLQQRNLLRAAFSLPNDAWLSSALILSDVPGPAVFHPALQALAEILNRHLKAADKRLRWDQVQSIKVTVPAMEGWLVHRNVPLHAVHRSLPWLLSILVVGHALGPAELEPGWIRKNLDRIHHVLSRVEIIWEPRSNLDGWLNAIKTVPWLFCGLAPDEVFGAIPMPLQKRFILRHRVGVSKSLADTTRALHLDDFQFSFPSGIQLYTTRGGRWPERRSIPRNGPGTTTEESLPPASSLSLDAAATDWLGEVLAPS